jgi:RHS repeat-associated protein
LTVPSSVKDTDCGSALPDASGSGDKTWYCHDAFDRLIRQRPPGSAEEQTFDYDGMDRRDNRTDHVGGTTVQSGYKYVGSTSTLSGQEVVVGSASSRVSFDRDSDNRPLAVTLQSSGSSTATTKTYATDANGNPTGLEESNGSVPGATNRYVYDPYGDLDAAANSGISGDAATNPLRFNGFDYDSAIKTYDMQARDYRPSSGRFLQTDRYESAQADLSLVADPLTQNRYDFGAADPVSNVEFDGHHYTITGDPDSPALPLPVQSNKSSKKSSSSSSDGNGASDQVSQGRPTTQAVAIAKQQRHAEVHTKYDDRRYNLAYQVARQSITPGCLETCSKEEKNKNKEQTARALLLGLPAKDLNLAQGHSMDASLGLIEGSFLNPVDLPLTLVGPGKLGFRALESLATRGGAKEGERGGLNLFKWHHPTSETAEGWREGDRMLTVPWKGTPKATWKENASRLRHEMRSGEPIRETYTDSQGQLLPTRGFLNAERELLRNHGWQYDESTRMWSPGT